MAAISVTSTAPAHEDGLIHQGDLVTFAIEGTGVITILGSRDGVTLASWSLVRGDLDVVLTPSVAWRMHPGPLHCEALLREQRGKRVVTVASCDFEVAG